MQDPFTAKIVSRDARDFARNMKIKKQNSMEEAKMAINEKTIEKIRKDFDKHNEQVLKIYRRNGDKSLLELLYLNSYNPEEVSEEFGISLEDAAELVEKDKAAKADPVETIEEASRKASAVIRNILGQSGDEDEAADANEANETEEDDSDYDDEDVENSDDASDDDFDLIDLFKHPEKIIEGLCFLGEVVQDTSEKICDTLDESVERVMEHDFDD